MFEQTFVDGTGKTNKSWTILLSFGIQMLLIAVGVIIPLIYFERDGSGAVWYAAQLPGR